MEQYIPKSALVAEIEKLKGKISDGSSYCNGWQHALRMLELSLDTFNAKEVDLKEERIKECPFKKVGCEIYEGHILECKGACSWVVDHLKLKELKAQKG